MARYPRQSLFSRLSNWYSTGLILISLIALLTTVLVLLRPSTDHSGTVFWTFSRVHIDLYRPLVEEWNATAMAPSDGITERSPIVLQLKDPAALERQMLSGFFTGTPVAELIEGHSLIMPKAWRGPLEAVGFHDLTPFLKRDGLLDRINPASFSPWTYKGRIFGLPRDVSPVLLAYRADLLEAAGIDARSITTWEEWMTRLAPLVEDLSGDGVPDRFLLEFANPPDGLFGALYQQAGGRYLDADGLPVFNNSLHARLMARVAIWAARPGNVIATVPQGSGAGNRLLMDGYVVAWLQPDWRSHLVEAELGSLHGKVRVMPLPAWEPGGRRTSVMGGTMLGLPKLEAETPDAFEKRWAIAKYLYCSEQAASRQFSLTNMVTPVRDFWKDATYDQPNAFFSGQAIGRMYVEQAAHVPMRNASPYFRFCQVQAGQALNKLIRWAERTGQRDPDILQEKAHEFLTMAEDHVLLQMRRNVFQKLPE